MQENTAGQQPIRLQNNQSGITVGEIDKKIGNENSVSFGKNP